MEDEGEIQKVMYKVILLVTVTFTFIGGALSEQIIPPIVREHPRQRVLFVPRDDIVLSCTARAHPAPRYHWTKDGEDIDMSIITKYTLDIGSLRIHKATEDDAAVYNCWASNIGGMDKSPDVNVTMLFLGKFPDNSATPSRRMIRSGDNVVLPCQCPASNPPVKRLWMRNDIGLSADDNLYFDLRGSLHIASYSRVYDGLYSCRCTNYALRSMVTTPSIELVMNSKNTISKPVTLLWKSESPVIVLVGDTLQIQCLFSSSPPATISWQKKGGTLAPGRHNLINGGNTLSILGALPSDAGKYECVAFNELSLHPVTATVDVTIGAIPVFEKIPSSLNVTRGEDITLVCISSGIPRPQTVWYINWKHITSERSNIKTTTKSSEFPDMSINEFHITGALPRDTMVVSCVAGNSHGIITTSSYIGMDIIQTEAIAASGSSNESVFRILIMQCFLLCLLNYSSVVYVDVCNT